VRVSENPMAVPSRPTLRARPAGAAVVIAAVAALAAAPRGDVHAEDAAAYDPCAAARAAESEAANPWSTIPPMCYTRTAGAANPCWACHTGATAPNSLADWPLQKDYAFAPPARTNPWTNLFVDRSKEVAAIGDSEVLAWIRTDNYGPLRDAMSRMKDYRG